MKVGDYVRAEDDLGVQLICKIKARFKDFCNTDEGYWDDDHIIKSSPNIIDLIEVGDYVNGEQVSRIKQCPEYHLGDGILIFNEHNETIYSNFRTSKYYDIKSIVTKESMERVTYYVK